MTTRDPVWEGLAEGFSKDLNGHLASVLPLKEYQSLHVGCDSKNYTGYSLMVTTVCVREKGSGVIVAYRRDKQGAFDTVRDRLFAECYTLLDLAQDIHSRTGIAPTVHVDINPLKEYKSNNSYDEITGILKGCGYNVVTKPHAWAADIADMFTR
jgi:predicted RNase H-related nuclease YkuK (DUF458 family)